MMSALSSILVTRSSSPVRVMSREANLGSTTLLNFVSRPIR